MRIALVAVFVSACSTGSGPPARAGSSPGPSDEAVATTDVGVPFERVGELGSCDPTGRWRAVGTFLGVGNCVAAAEPVVFEVQIVRGSSGFRLVPPPEAAGRGDSLTAVGDACALSLELHYRLAERDQPNVVLFADLVLGAKGAATWDEYEPTPSGVVFSADQGKIRCSDTMDVAVELAAAPKVRHEDDQQRVDLESTQ
jgi:hypothetical protein